MNTTLPETYMYYLRASKGEAPTAAIAIGLHNGVYARGVSICSTDEQFSRKEGRKLAISRMNRAFGWRKNSGVIGMPIPKCGVRQVAWEFLALWARDFDRDIGYKSEYDIEPTQFEQYMFSRTSGGV